MVRFAGWAAAALLACSAQAAESPVAAPTEKLQLKPSRVKGLLLGYGYTVGEYGGEVRSMAQSTRAPLFSSDKAKTTFTFSHVGSATPVTVSCNGGESRLGFGWIDFKRQDLAYVCRFDGGAPDATFALALSDAGLMASLYQPQRAAELTYGGTTVRAITRKVSGALPIGGGVMSYKILSADGREIGAMVRGMLQPSFYLPPAGSPDRDAAALMALILYTFPDPANASR
jgi:hypothetical protein